MHVRAAQERDQRAANDGSPQSCLGGQAAGNGKGHGQGQGYDTHGGPSTQITDQALAVVVVPNIKNPRAKLHGNP